VRMNGNARMNLAVHNYRAILRKVLPPCILSGVCRFRADDLLLALPQQEQAGARRVMPALDNLKSRRRGPLVPTGARVIELSTGAARPTRARRSAILSSSSTSGMAVRARRGSTPESRVLAPGRATCQFGAGRRRAR
jgi:hypothetical protein